MNDEFITSLIVRVIQITSENYGLRRADADLFFDISASCQDETRDIDVISRQILLVEKLELQWRHDYEKKHDWFYYYSLLERRWL